MKPAVGITGAYITLKCSLRVEVIEYEDLGNIERIKLKVLKNLNKDLGCPYEEGQEFFYNRPKDADPSKLEVQLILE